MYVYHVNMVYDLGLLYFHKAMGVICSVTNLVDTVSRVAEELQSKGWAVLTVLESELGQCNLPKSPVLAVAAKLKTKF